MEPPRPGEIEQLKREGKLQERLAKAKALANDRVDSDLLERAMYRAKRAAMTQRGLDPNTLLPAPPPVSKLTPTKGNVRFFALLIDFPDYPAAPFTGYAGYSTQPQIHSALFGDGSLLPANPYPYESLRNYYERASYNQLHLSGVTLGWYRAGYSRASMGANPTDAQREQLIKEAIASFDGAVDFSQFNNDTSDNKIEFFTVIWTGPHNGWSNFWWGYQTSWGDPSYTVDGCKLGKYTWQWAGDYGAMSPFTPVTAIHETGHALGLPDYYDYDDTVGPGGGVGKLDMMDGSGGDHNAFSKWLLDWITPTVVAAGSRTLTLNPSGTSQDAVVIMPGATSSDAFREFYIAQNRYRVGNDPVFRTTSGYWYPTDGMLIWHVDARLDSSGWNYASNNSFTPHKLLKLMEADGLERIEAGATADAAIYYIPGKAFGPLTTPSSRNYQGVDTGVNITGISRAGSQMTATFSIDNPRRLATLTVAKTGNGSGSVTSLDGGINLGSDPVESYPPGATVTLTAVPAPGCVFTGWSDGGLSRAGRRSITLTADTTITANFATTLVLDEDFDPQSTAPPLGWSPRVTAGTATWWFDYPEYNDSGGTGAAALGAAYELAGYFDEELWTYAMDLSGYNRVGLEFKTSLPSPGTTANVDVSTNGAAGPWTTVWTNTGALAGPRTVVVDLTAAAAGRRNVMLRFRHYGPGIWWVIDDVKVMAASTLNDAIPQPVPIPRARGPVAVDGVLDPAEWNVPEIPMGGAYQSLIPNNWQGMADYYASVRMQWDDDALYFAVRTMDESLNFSNIGAVINEQNFQFDGLDIYLGLREPQNSRRTVYDNPGDHHFRLMPLSGSGQPVAGALFSDPAEPVDLGYSRDNVRYAATPGGYTLEGRIRWSYPLNTVPRPGQIIGFNLVGNDVDAAGVIESSFSLSGLDGSKTNPSRWTTAILEPLPATGDVNGDGTVDVADVILAARIAAGLQAGTRQQVFAADGYRDARITLREVLWVLGSVRC